MKRLFCQFIFLFFFHTIFHAQDINQIQEKIINTYNQIEIDDKEAISGEEIKKLCEESKKISFPEGEIRGLTLLQKVALMNGDYILSGKYSDEAEVLAMEQNDYNALIAIYLYRGKIHIILDKYIEAQADLQKAVDFAYKIKNMADQHIQLCRVFANLAGMSEGNGDSKNWYNYTVKSLTAIETMPTRNLTDYQKSKYYYLYIFELMNMGNYYGYAVNTPKPQLSEPYFKRMLAFEKTAPEYFRILELEAYESMSSFYLLKGDYQKAIDYAQKLLSIEKNKSNHRERLMA